MTDREVTRELRVPLGLIAQGMDSLLAIAALAFLLCAVEAIRRSKTDPAGATS